MNRAISLEKLNPDQHPDYEGVVNFQYPIFFCDALREWAALNRAEGKIIGCQRLFIRYSDAVKCFLRFSDEFDIIRVPAAMGLGAAFPINAKVGSVFFHTEHKISYIYDGETWLQITC